MTQPWKVTDICLIDAFWIKLNIPIISSETLNVVNGKMNHDRYVLYPISLLNNAHRFSPRLCVQTPAAGKSIQRCVFSAKVKTKDAGSHALCVDGIQWERQTASCACFFHRINCVTTLLISITVVPVRLICIWFYLLIKDVWRRGWYQWSNHFQTLTQQCQLVTWIQKHPSLLFANPQFPSPPLPPCLRSPGKLCISALGGKHYTGLAQGSVSLNILSWPLAVILLMARVSSSTFIRTSAEGEVRGSRFFTSGRKNKTKKTTRNKNVSRPADVL